MKQTTAKKEFKISAQKFSQELREYVNAENGQWTVKGFIDIYRNVYAISSDTKIISKVLEIHLFSKIREFAEKSGYRLVLAEHQNYYPDISFVSKKNANIKFAVDIKTTYRRLDKPFLCNGFTLGSHGTYFSDRASAKNIQFPYGTYAGHFCLGAIYSRARTAIDETAIHALDNIRSIPSVAGDFQFFAAEKWKIAGDKSGSGNTANIGSINNIQDIVGENGMFSKLGEGWFDDYWMNYNKITVSDGKGGAKKINTLKDFVKYKKGDISLIVPKRNRAEA